MTPPHLLLMLLALLLFAGNFTMAKFGLEHLPPFMLTALRFMLVAVLVLPFVPRLAARDMVKLLRLSVMLCTLHFGLFFGAMHLGMDIPSCVILMQLGVPISCALGAWLLKEPFGTRQTIGMAVSFAGLLMVEGSPNVQSLPLLSILAALGGACAAGFANLWMRQMRDLGIFYVIGWTALFAIPQLLFLSFVVENYPIEQLASLPLIAIASVTYTAIGSTVIAHAIWFGMIQRYPLNQVTPFSLLVPFLSIIIGQYFFPAELTFNIITGGLLTILGVAVISLPLPAFMRARR